MEIHGHASSCYGGLARDHKRKESFGNMNSSEYRALQEAFVANWNGTSLFEVSNVVSSAPAGLMLYRFVARSKTPHPTWLAVLIDHLFIVLPLLLTMTVGSDWTLLINLSLLLLSFCASCLSYSEWPASLPPLPTRRPFITAYRASINIATAVAILAVDFPIFPRRFAKTETYGTSVMDVGVGAFIVSNAIVARKESLGKAIRGSAPLILLGLARLFTIKATDYQEHVTEYGVHWNFFFTLAVVKILSSVLISHLGSRRLGLIGLCIGCAYQLCLSFTGLRERLLSDSQRTGLLDANREGIASCFGYLALYMLAVELGRFLSVARSRFRDWVICLFVLISIDVFLYGILALLTSYVEPVSRRMANLSYVIWQLGYNVYLLVVFLLVDVACLLFASRNTSANVLGNGSLIESISQNQLAYFLLANLLTGCVNLCMYTVTAPTLLSFTVVFLYMLTLTVLISALYVYNIRTKVW
ncbi:uncharacterized protein [Oscarella lobularis]|uniref:uncharacterized protein n=1 Tax=Oscarella lobularis TaxID=121494 RepID=UPI003314190B